MGIDSLNRIVRHLRVSARPGDGVTDGELLERYRARRDDAAFEALVRRHGPMVLGVCRRALRDAQDAEDAFQAAFRIPNLLRDLFAEGALSAAFVPTYTRALETAPADARLYRQRGHRYVSVRRFDLAVADLKRAAQLNDRDFDIWYHLGLAHYLRGEFRRMEGELPGALLLFRKAAELYDPNTKEILSHIYMLIFETEMKLNRPIAARAAATSTKQPAIVTDLREPVSSWRDRSDETVAEARVIAVGVKDGQPRGDIRWKK